MKRDPKIKGKVVTSGCEERLINDGWQDEIIKTNNLLSSGWSFADLNRFMICTKVINKSKSKSPLVLDVGCSCGKLLQVQQTLMREPGTKSMIYVGMDARESATQQVIDFANEHFSENYRNNIHTENMNIVDRDSCKRLYKKYGKFDVIVMLEVIEHIPDEFIQTVLKCLKNMLADDGAIILSTPMHLRENEDMWWPEAHYKEYTIKQIEEMFSGYFDICEEIGNHVIAKSLKEKLKEDEYVNGIYKRMLRSTKNGTIVNELFCCVYNECCKGQIYIMKKKIGEIK